MEFNNVYFNLTFLLDMYPVLDILNFKAVNHVVDINCNNYGDIIRQKIFNKNEIIAGTLAAKCDLVPNPSLNCNKLGIIVNTSCYNWQNSISCFSEERGFKSPYLWLIYAEDLNKTVLALSNHRIEIDSDVIIILKENGEYTIYEVFHTDYAKGTFTIRPLGYWKKKLYINKSKRIDMSNVHIKCPVVITDKIVNEPFMKFLMNPNKKTVDSLHKLKFFSVFSYIRDMYNFSYEVQRTNSWGYFRNGSFDGLVGALQRQEADIGGSPLYFRGDRARLIDYIAETWVSRQCFFFRHPKHPGGFYTIYTRPLTASVWYCILGVLLISATILYLTLNKMTTYTMRFDTSFSLALLFIWSALCQQGMAVYRGSASIKMVVLITFLYTVTIYQYYNATVVSTLLREPPKNIRTLEDLLKSNLKAGAEDVLYVKDFFKRTTDEVAINMYKKKITSEHQYNFYPAERGMALVKQGGFAFHVDSVVAYRIMRHSFSEREICEAHEVAMYPPQKMGVVIRKLSPYKEHFTYGIRKMYESGLMDRLRSVWDEPKPPCVHTPDSSIFAVSIREFSTALLALTSGVITAVIVLCLEIIVHALMNRPKKRLVVRN
ncbi:hypothetical protein ACJJTC_016282 [Scirpophaga incertulas]